MDLDNIAPGPDLDKIDLSTADRGDNLPSPEPVKPAPTTEPAEPESEGAEAEGAAEADAAAAEDEPPRDEKGRFAGKDAKIPKARFDEAVGKEREAREAAERRAAELERQLQERARTQETSAKVEELEAQISALEKKHADLLLDGDSEGAAALMRQIRHAERQIARAEAVAETQRHMTQTLEAERVETVIARMEADFPQFNPQSEQYDQDLVELVLTKQRSLIEREGMSPSKALERAGKDVAERFLVERQEQGERAGLGKAESQTDRKAAQVQKNLDTQKRQAPSMKDAGLDSDKAGIQGKVDVTKLTAEEFAALPESTKAKLRGDVL